MKCLLRPDSFVRQRKSSKRRQIVNQLKARIRGQLVASLKAYSEAFRIVGRQENSG